MSTEFAINIVAFGDKAGLGLWLVGHYRQHLRYNTFLASKSPPVIISEFPILNVGETESEVRSWQDAHEKWHQLIRPFANVTGANLADADFDDPQQWYNWQDVHNAEHRLIDQAFGLG